MDSYAFENGLLKLIDTEIGLSLEEPFTPVTVPPKPVNGKRATKGHVVRVRCFDDDSIDEAYMEKDEVPNGQYLLFYPSGATKMESYYVQGQLHGPSTFFQESGQVLTKSWFIHGNRQGKSWWYYATGALYSIQRFHDNLWHGRQEYYYADGTLKTVMHYTHGVLNGAVRLYASTGNLERELHYHQGVSVKQAEL